MAVHVDVCERGSAAVGGERGGGWVGDFEFGVVALDERDDVGFDTGACWSRSNKITPAQCSHEFLGR